MASAMATGSEVSSECIERIRIEVRAKVLKMVLVCPGFFGFALSVLMGLLSGSVDGDGARYWRLIYWFMGVTEEIKSPCGYRGLWGIRLVSSRPPQQPPSFQLCSQ